ncbi:MAG: TIGR04283 family arsenosugar biosynthesis glycosyltransferase [Planctomycetota bacterium]|nr:TIGR04283 family arsenosugar biosynthesis glycosyltransferase [Planctomycetota bacterium]
MRPALSVILPVLNDRELLPAALESVFASPARVEAIVVDGGSTDGSAETARALGARVIPSPRGRARQMNAGAAEARARVLLFLHADTRLPRNYEAQVREALGRPAALGGAFRLRLDAAGLRYRVAERLVNARARLLGLPYGDQALFVRAETFRAMGGFPEQCVMEDYEFVRRLKARGPLALAPVCAVTSARAWQRHGVLGYAALNWTSVAAYRLGVSPGRIAAWRGVRP